MCTHAYVVGRVVKWFSRRRTRTNVLIKPSAAGFWVLAEVEAISGPRSWEHHGSSDFVTSGHRSQSLPLRHDAFCQMP